MNRSAVPLAVKKVLAFVVIAGCLGAQTYAIVRPSGARLYPFIAYPMYSGSWPPGHTYRAQELWARTCGDRPRTWEIEPLALGYQDNHFLFGLVGTAGGSAAALDYRAHLSDLARSRLVPRPCLLQVWERTIPTARDGIDIAALRHPRRTLLRGWPVDDPGAVRTFPPR